MDDLKIVLDSINKTASRGLWTWVGLTAAPERAIALERSKRPFIYLSVATYPVRFDPQNNCEKMKLSVVERSVSFRRPRK